MKTISPPRSLLALILIVAVATVAASQFAPTQVLAERQSQSRESQRDRDSRFDQNEEEGNENDWLGQIAVYRELLGLIQQFHAIARDKSVAGVSAVMGAEDHFEEPEQVVAFLERMLNQANDKSIQRAIRIKLTEMYKNMGRQEDAQKQLEALILQ